MTKTRAQRCGDLIRRLGSDFDGEIVVVVRALRRTLESEGRDLNDIAAIVERGGKIDEAGMKQLYDAGFEDGHKAGIAEGRKQDPTIFKRVDSEGLYEMAQFCWERIDRLPSRHHHFIEHMVELAGEAELSPKQTSYLKSLYRQLGGR